MQGNILIDEDDTVRLTDFGMALIAEATSYQYASVHGGGATRWQAPELIDPDEFGISSSRPTFASDVYSFSCICIEVRAPMNWNVQSRTDVLILLLSQSCTPANLHSLSLRIASLSDVLLKVQDLLGLISCPTQSGFW